MLITRYRRVTNRWNTSKNWTKTVVEQPYGYCATSSSWAVNRRPDLQKFFDEWFQRTGKRIIMPD